MTQKRIILMLKSPVDVNSINTDNDMPGQAPEGRCDFWHRKISCNNFSTSLTPAGGNKYKLYRQSCHSRCYQTLWYLMCKILANMMEQKQNSFKAKTTINRFDYNLKWDKAT